MGPITLESAFLVSGSDRELAEAVVKGGDAEFATLFEAHKGHVYRTALAVLGAHEPALDAVQDTFVKVHRGLNQWRGDSSLRTWITRIAVRCAIDIRRRLKTHTSVESIPEPFHDPRPAIDAALRLARLRNLADRLQGQSGLILRLRLFGGQSNKDIALTLDLSEANVRVQLSNAVRALREKL